MHPKIQENNDRLLATLTDEILALRRMIMNLEERVSRYNAALTRIANQDYRGNRSHESEIARQALKEQL